MQRTTTALRGLLAGGGFINLPSAYDPIGGRLIASLGFPAVYCGGFVTGGSRCTSEPLLTMDEQVRVAGDVAAAVPVPLVADVTATAFAELGLAPGAEVWATVKASEIAVYTR